jgi:hypothetical protein
MLRYIGLSALCLFIVASAMLGESDSPTSGLQHPQSYRAVSGSVKEDTEYGNRPVAENVEVPKGTRTVGATRSQSTSTHSAQRFINP